MYFVNKHPVADIGNIKIMMIRNVMGLIAFNSMVFAAKNLPIFLLQILKGSQTFVVMGIAYLINGEKIAKYQIICMIGAFIGILLLTLSGNESNSPNFSVNDIKNQTMDGNATDSTTGITSKYHQEQP